MTQGIELLLQLTNLCGIAHSYRKAGPFYAVHSTRKYFMKNVFCQAGKITPYFELKVPPPITKCIRYVQCCATDELCYLLACNLYQHKEEGQALHFYVEISEENIHIFLQSTIENQQKGRYLMSWSTPGTLCLRTRSTPGTLYLSARNAQGTHITLSGFPVVLHF